MTRDEMRRLTEERWEALRLGILAVPADQRETPNAIGYWSVKDLLGHLAFWETYAIETIARVRADEPDPQVDVEAINERVYHERRDWTWDDGIAALAETHAALLDALATLPETVADDVAERLSDDSWAHYDEHLDDINAYLDHNTPATT